MPSQHSIKLVRESAKFLAHPDSRTYREYLHPTLQTAIAICEAIPFTGASYEEIAEKTNLNLNTVKQFTSALFAGGYPIARGLETVVSPLGGRPRAILGSELLPLSEISMADFLAIPGIGEAKAMEILKVLQKYGIGEDGER